MKGDQTMTETTEKQKMVLRSVSKNHVNEKRVDTSLSEDMEVDSDGENNLIIDCDTSSEENLSSKNSTPTKTREKKHSLLRVKIPKGDVSQEDTHTVDKQEFANGLTADIKKRRKTMKFCSKWYKTSQIKKGNFKRMKKPLKRLLHRKKLKEKNSGKSAIKNIEDENVDDETIFEKNTCPICQVKFTDRHSFTLHIREHNTDKFSHVCKICSKQLSSASSLDRHMYVHSGERPFECNICKLRFTTNGNMHRHMKIHEGNDKLKSKGENNRSSKKQSDDKQKHLSNSSANLSNQESAQTSLNADEVPKNDVCDVFLSSTIDYSSKCPVCGKKFESSDLLKHHMAMHSNNPVKCSICNVTSENYTAYENHQCSQNGDAVLLSSPKTGFHDLNFMEFSSSKFAFVAKRLCEQQSRNSSSIFFSWECHKCAKAFPSNQALYQHELSHEVGDTFCHTCDCDFTSPGNFCKHQLKHRLAEHCSNVSQESTTSCKEDFLAVLELCNKQILNDMEKKTNSKLRYFDTMHYFVHRPSSQIKTEDYGNDFADIKSIISLTSKTPAMPDMQTSPVAASPASPIPTNGNVPSSPVIEGSANPSTESPTAGDDYPNSPLDREEENLSKDSLPSETFNCKVCSETFLTSIALKQHMKIHSSTPLHQCNFCPYQSVDKSTLKRHMRKHNGEHPFKCSICDYVFTTKANGHRHVKNKHKLSEQDAAEAVVYNPNMHESKDSDTVLNETNNTETVCKYCKVDFKYNRVLRHHLRSLNNSCSRKPYFCGICKQGFSTKNNCIRHITNHHPESKNKAKELVVVNEANNNSNTQDATPNVNEETSEGESMQTESQPLNLTLFYPNGENSRCSDKNGQEFSGSDAEMAVAQSLVSLSELIPPQDKPLDLTLCALDLTQKNNSNSDTLNDAMIQQPPEVLDLCIVSHAVNSQHEKKSSETPIEQQFPINLEVVAQPLNLAKKSPSPISLIKKVCESNLPQVNTNESAIICLPHVITPVHNSSKKLSIPVIYSNPKSAPILPAPNLFSNDSSQSEDALKNSQKLKKFSCDICLKGFTLKSNRERHVKNHHPEHARPPRSRNYIPTLSPSSVQKQNTSILSEKTRDALRVALIAKTNNSKPDEATTTKKLPPTNFSDHFASMSSPLPLTSKAPASITQNTFSSTEKIDMTDLASVSDVIDTVNCQNFKQYLLDAKGVSDSSGADEPPNRQDVEIVHEDVGLQCDELACEKKSSYAKCAKSIHCTYCKRKFPWKSSLSRHFLTHTGLKPHKCPKCPLSFTTKSNRDRHLFRQHGSIDEVDKLSDKPYKCNSCPNSYFSTKGKLKKHFYLKHLSKNDSSYSVSNGSNNNTSNNISLQNDDYQKQSSDELEAMQESCSGTELYSPPLECHLCGNTFKAQEDLLSHLKEVHPLEVGISEKPSSKRREEYNIVPTIKIEPPDTIEMASESSLPSNTSDSSAISKDLNSVKRTLQFGSVQELNHNPESSSLDRLTNAVEKITSVNHSKTAQSSKNSTTSSPKKRPNSLLYLFAAAQQANSSENSVAQPVTKNTERTKVAKRSTDPKNCTEDDNSLILNLLGLKDPEFLDEMLDSAVRSRVKKEKIDP